MYVKVIYKGKEYNGMRKGLLVVAESGVTAQNFLSHIYILHSAECSANMENCLKNCLHCAKSNSPVNSGNLHLQMHSENSLHMYIWQSFGNNSSM